MNLDLTTERLYLTYTPDVEILEWLGGGRCGVYYLGHEGHYAGAVSLVSHSRIHGEIGYKIEPAYRGLGFATEAVDAVMARVAADHGFTMLSAKARADNLASCRVLTKTGFLRAGTKLSWSQCDQCSVAITTYHRFAAQPAI